VGICLDHIEFLLSVVGPTPKRILEVCCGSGRILVPLANAGHDKQEYGDYNHNPIECGVIIYAKKGAE